MLAIYDGHSRPKIMPLVCRLGYNHMYAGSTQHAPPLPSTAFTSKPKKLTPGWRIDHIRKEVSPATALVPQLSRPKHQMQTNLSPSGNAWS